MLVERSFSVVKKNSGETNGCVSCPIIEVCYKFVDRQSGDIIMDRIERFSEQTYDYKAIEFIKRTSNQASICRKSFPNFKIVETTPKEIHRIVGRGGNTIAESNSFLGLIWQYFLVTIGAFVIIAIIGLIITGIGSLFN